jgi:tetratricopeptide (TPR) repeat protein
VYGRNAAPVQGESHAGAPVVRPRPEAADIYVRPPVPGGPPAFTRSDVRARIERLWLDRKRRVLETDEFNSGPQSLTLILEALHRQGYRSVSGMETNLVHEARLLLQRQRLEQARRSLDAALELDPNHLPALSAQAEICIGRKPVKIPEYLTASLGAITNTFWPALTSLANLALVSLFTLLVMACVFQLVLAARHQKLFRHSLYESWRDRLPGSLIPVFGWCLFLAPLFFLLGPFWVFFGWTIVLWRFAARVERLLAVLSLVVLVLIMPAVDTVEGTFRDLNTGELHLLSEALGQRLLSPRGEALIEKDAETSESASPLSYDEERRFLAASIHRRMGRDDAAFERYAAIPAFHYLYPMAQNNIGNIYFSLNQFDLAIQHYRKAVDVWPEYAECFFNISSAQFEVYDFDHSDQSLSRAQRLAPLAMSKLINEESRGLKTLDHQIPATFLWTLVWDSLRHNAGRHFSGLGPVFPEGDSSSRENTLLLLLATAMVSALAGALLGWINRHEEVGLCRSCGQAYCRLCGPDPMKREECQQCTHLGSRMSGIPPEIQKRKLSQISRYQLWRKIRDVLSTLILPGLLNIRRGRTMSGMALAGSWVFLVSLLLGLPRFLPPIGLRSAPWSLDPLLLAAGGLAILLWSLNLITWLVKSLRQGDWRSMDSVARTSGRSGAKRGEGI